VLITLYDVAGQARVVGSTTQQQQRRPGNGRKSLSMDADRTGVADQELIAIDDTQGHEKGRSASLVGAPIRSRGRLLGTVSVGSLRPYSYSETDQAIFLQMISGLAVAIENAEAYTQSQHVAQNAALINEIATHLQQHSGIEEMLHITIRELGEALGSRRARIRWPWCALWRLR